MFGNVPFCGFELAGLVLRRFEPGIADQRAFTAEAGDVAKVKIVSMTPFGAFAQVIPGVDGLIHISQISNTRIGKPSDVLAIGQEVDAKITEIDLAKKRVSLSIRALLADEAAPEADEELEDAAPVVMEFGPPEK